MAVSVVNPIILACWTIYILYWGISAFFVKKSVRRINWKSAIVWRVVFIVLIIIIIANRKSLPIENIGNISTFVLFKNFFLEIIGTILVIIGLLGALWARTSLGRNWSGYVTYKEDHELVTDGPYRFVRHPIYSSILLMMLGTFLNFSSTFLLIVAIIMFIVFLLRIKEEEKIMISLFGKKYLNYKKRTKALIPHII